MPFKGRRSMTAEELKLHFTMQNLRHDIVSAPLKAKARKAAVLMAFEERDGELCLIFTTRPTHLRAHPGQISFPGGKIEETDLTPLDTALRETHEEIGLNADNLELLGQFPPHKTFTGFEITPVLAMVKAPFEMRIDPGEVAECFYVPLSFFMNDSNRLVKPFMRQGHSYKVVFIPWQGRLIWGATAAMIDLLCRHLKDDGDSLLVK